MCCCGVPGVGFLSLVRVPPPHKGFGTAFDRGIHWALESTSLRNDFVQMMSEDGPEIRQLRAEMDELLNSGVLDDVRDFVNIPLSDLKERLDVLLALETGAAFALNVTRMDGESFGCGCLHVSRSLL